MLKHVVAALFCCLLLIGLDAEALVAPEHEGRPNFDIRTAAEKPAALVRLRSASPGAAARSAAARQAFADAEAALRQSTPGLRIHLGAESGGPDVVGVARGARVLTGPSSQRREAIARGFVERNAALWGLTRNQAAQLQLDADYVNPAGNLGWVRLAQYANGRPVFGSEVTVALTPAGEIARVVGQLAGATEPAEAAQLATVGAAQAVMLAATDVGIAMLPGDLQQLSVAADGRSARFASRVLDDEVEAKQVYFPLGDGALELAWSMVIWEPVNAYYTVIAARDGSVLWRKNITDHEAHTYRVYDGANPAPFQPGPINPTLGQQAPRVATVDLAIDSQVSTNDPWLAVGQATTDGNNVEAGLDIVGPDGVDAPIGESGLNAFLYSSNPPPGSPAPGEGPTTTDSRNAAVTNLFYWSNRFHNLTYDLGFTEPARNFQNDNFGRGGLGGDRVRSEAQDSSGVNNANFNTPPDGGRGRNQMYLWTLATPNRDGSLDADVILHELTHGLSNRLHNNAAGLNTNMARGMGEGWSDFYAHSLLAKPTDPINGIYTIGGYVTLGGSGANDNYYYGIRRFPKAVIAFTGGPGNRPYNPLTFADVDSTQFNIADGAYPRGPFGSSIVDQVHNLGEVWSSALWEARAQIIGDMGAVAGNQRMLQLVTDGMKLSPSSPTFLQARDAIIAADCAAYGGSNELNLWAGFALRGMGFSAQVLNAGSGNNDTRVVESFAGPLDGNLPVDVGTTGWQALSCPTANRNPTPGDVVQLVVPITNPLCGTALSNVVVSAPGGGSQSYPTLAGGASLTALVNYTIPGDAVCGTTIQVPVTITHDGGTQSIMVDVPVGVAPVGATAFTNNTLINLPNGQPGTTSGVASPYPSNITVSGITQPVVGVRVSLNDLAHTWPGDVDMLLVGPTGQKMIVFSDVFETRTNTPPQSVVELRDDAADVAPATGSIPLTAAYRPTNRNTGDTFAAPAPAAPFLSPAPAGTETFATAFGGLDPNGTWSLYIVDDAGGDTGTLASGWTLTILTSQPVACIPCAVAGVTVTESGGNTAVTEGGATDSYEVVLTAAPTADVSVNLTFDPAQLTVEGETDGTASLLFTSANWNTPQVVDVVATNDQLVEAPLASSQIVQTIFSTDPAYAAINPADVSAAVGDNDSAEVAFAANDDNVAESAGSFQKAVILTINASGSGPASLAGALSIPLSFTEGSALEPEDFTLTSAGVTFPTGSTTGAVQNAAAAIVNDAIDEDAESFAINLVTAGAPSNISFGRSSTNVQIDDNDTAGVTLVQSGGGTAATEGGTTDTYTLVLNSQPTAPVTISLIGVQVTPSTAAPPPLANKAAPPPASLVFSAANWNQPQTVTVTADNDTVVEGAHAGSVTHDVTSSDAKYQALPVPPLAVAITDNDTAELIFSSAGFTAVEGAQFSPGATLKVTANGAPGGSIAAEVVATLNLTPGTAGTDDVALSGSFVFPAGSVHDTVLNSAQVGVTDDRAVEASESFDVALAVSSGLATTSATNNYSIDDNDSAAIGFALPTSNAPEGSTPHGVNALLTITGVGSGPLLLQDASSVVITDTPGTATTPADYTRTTASVSFPAGSADGATQPIQSSIVDDALFEGNHTFQLGFGAVTAASAAVTAAGAHTVTITDNDPMPTISISSPSQPEGNGGNTPMTFTVSLSAPAGVNVTFTRATADGSATLIDNDYLQLAAAGASIAAGDTSLPIVVQIVGDTTFEGNESFSLNLSNIVNATPAGGTVIEGSPATLSGTGTIEEDDQQPTTTTISSDGPDPSVVGQPYTVVVNVAAISSSPVGSVTVSDGSASCGPVAVAAASSPNSTASCVLTSTTAGAKTLTASFSAGSTAFADSSGTTSHQVNAASTAISVVGPLRSRINQPTAFTFALSVGAPGAGTPAGTVTLSSGAASCNVTVPTPTPSCALTFTALGSRTVTAAFVPADGNFLASGSSGSGNAQTLVYAQSDIAVTKANGVTAYRPGDLLVYTVTVRNLGADAAAQIRVRDDIPAGLTDVVWTCDASGGVACVQASGSGNLNALVTSFPVGALLNYTIFGNVVGSPAQIANTAFVELPADTTIEDPLPGNNSVSDIDLLDFLLQDGFETVAINAASGSQRVPAGVSGRVAGADVPQVVLALADAQGEAVRVYARQFDGEVQLALARRASNGQLRLAPWQAANGEPEVVWTARPVADGWVLDSVELR